jgi:hypothetical protein
MLPACLCANYFDAVRLFDPSDSGFAVHRIVVAQLGVPEPPVPAILGIGLAVLVAFRRCKLR